MKPTFFKGVLVGAIVGAVVAAATTAIAATHVFNLEASNTAAAKTSVTGNFNDRLFQFTNTSTGSGATALSLTVGSGRPPLVVNSSRKVTNLNADQLDGLDSTSFVSTAKPSGLVGEAWHDVGTPTGVPWGGDDITCAELFDDCPWQNYTAATGWNPAGYYKDPLGVVHLKGLVWCSCNSNQQYVPGPSAPTRTVFTLPVGYRPAANEAATVWANWSYLHLAVHSNGDVEIRPHTDSETTDAKTALSLDGITFRAGG
jgi:hypothetical protein